jgi:hypothetical protein
MGTAALSTGIKRTRRGADNFHLVPRSRFVEIQVTSIPAYVFLVWSLVSEAQDNLTFSSLGRRYLEHVKALAFMRACSMDFFFILYPNRESNNHGYDMYEVHIIWTGAVTYCHIFLLHG